MATPRIRDNRALYLANRERYLRNARLYRQRHPEKTKAARQKWLADNPEKRREYVRAATTKKRYGITREQHKAMLEAQNYCCAVCGVAESKLSRRLCIDHDHDTGVVRGLVCRPCNVILGRNSAHINILRAAISYLEGHRVWPRN